jgi:hypothetical protein
MSIFAPTKNNAVARLEHLLQYGTDPGNAKLIGVTPKAAAAGSPGGTTVQADVDEPELAADIEQVALDQITARIAEEFAGHGLATLVTAILSAEGFQCQQAPPGPDGGIDITAGRGPLGLDTPRLLAQVKSGAQIGSPVVTQLHGLMTTHGAEQGLLVAWGGLSKPARDALRNQHLRVRVWEAADVVEAVLRTYDRLPEGIRTQLPLRRVWMLSDVGLLRVGTSSAGPASIVADLHVNNASIACCSALRSSRAFAPCVGYSWAAARSPARRLVATPTLTPRLVNSASSCCLSNKYTARIDQRWCCTVPAGFGGPLRTR